MTWPTKEDIEFFTSEEAKPIQKLWKPVFGDWLYVGKDARHDKSKPARGIVKSIFRGKLEVQWADHDWCLPFLPECCDWIPRLDQLIELLEERGWEFSRFTQCKNCKWHAWIFSLGIEIVEKMGWGATRSIALAKALLAVMEKEAQDGSPT